MKKEETAIVSEVTSAKLLPGRVRKHLIPHSMLMAFHESTGTPPDLISNVSISSIVCMTIEQVLQNK